jgi:hypothetical protein
MRYIKEYNEVTKKSIRIIIEEIVKEWGISYNGSPLTPCEINKGECNVFADELIHRLGRNGYSGSVLL